MTDGSTSAEARSCQHHRGSIWSGDQWVDVTHVINTLLDYSGEVTVNNRLAGDPCPGTLKSCIVEYEDGNESEYREHETIRRIAIKTAAPDLSQSPLQLGGEQWKWNIEQLKQYASWTNGKRVVSIVQGRGIDDLDDVLHQFEDFRIDKLIVRVDSDLWEMETFPMPSRRSRAPTRTRLSSTAMPRERRSPPIARNSNQQDSGRVTCTDSCSATPP